MSVQYVTFPKPAECPAPGYRDPSSGGPWGVGHFGYSWASTVSSTNGMNLLFYATHLDPGNTYGHTHGFLLRCLSE
ncbi:hypothetical protein [uncultured Rikenella sp.]|uniref:hypothetical protein n=1 Tax=uncultured Rikenella sp. TaxID=368003 RepID=UPI0025CEF262|nr:hypothetical protein [uncultured Rikenella sp.]